MNFLSCTNPRFPRLRFPLKAVIAFTLLACSSSICDAQSSAKSGAKSGTTFTPDPYFNRSSVKERATAPVNNQVRSLLHGSAWDPPASGSTANHAAASSTANASQASAAGAIAWEPPLTNVTPASVTPAKPAVAVSNVNNPGTNSIIRENNDFQFGQPSLAKPNPSSITKTVTNPYAVENAAPNAASNNIGNEFVASMPASKPSTATPETLPNKPFRVISDDNSFGAPAPKLSTTPKSDSQTGFPFSPDSGFSAPASKTSSAQPVNPVKAVSAAPVAKAVSETAPKNSPFGKTSAQTDQKDLGKPTDGSAPTADGVPFAASELLAKVGSEPIFAGDMLFEINQMLEKFMPTAPESAKNVERKKLVKRMLPKFVEQKLLYVGMLDLLPEEADVNDIVEQAAKEFDDKALPDMLKKAGVTEPSDLDAELRKMGSSLRKLRDTWARDQLTRYFLSQELDADKEITHQQLLDEYRENLDVYAVKARARWEQVMVRFDKFPNRQAARAKIIELGDQLVYGANFEALAKKESQGFQASDGGQHDWTGKDALVLKEIDKAIFSLPIGELSDIIETRDGLHIVRVKERQDAGRKPFSEAQVEIKKRIAAKQRNDAFEKHLAELRQRIPVEYFR